MSHGLPPADTLIEELLMIRVRTQKRNIPILLDVVRQHDRLRALAALQAQLDEAIEHEDPALGWDAVERAQAPAGATGESDLIAALWEVAAEPENPEPTVTTGLAAMDELLDGGFRPGELIVAAARPSIGKSAWAMTVAGACSDVGTLVGIWTLEMTAKQWVRRLAANIALIPARALRSGPLSEHHAEAFSGIANRSSPRCRSTSPTRETRPRRACAARRAGWCGPGTPAC